MQIQLLEGILLRIAQLLRQPQYSLSYSVLIFQQETSPSVREAKAKGGHQSNNSSDQKKNDSGGNVPSPTKSQTAADTTNQKPGGEENKSDKQEVSVTSFSPEVNIKSDKDGLDKTIAYCTIVLSLEGNIHCGYWGTNFNPRVQMNPVPETTQTQDQAN